MFKENAKIAYGVDRLKEHLATMRRGEMITHHAIEQLTGIGLNDPQYPSIRSKLRRVALKEFKFNLVAVPGVGYRIVTAKEQANDAMSRSSRASRQLHRGMREVASTPDEECTDHERRVKQMKLQAFRAGRQHTRKANHVDAMLAKVPESLPRRVAQGAL